MTTEQQNYPHQEGELKVTSLFTELLINLSDKENPIPLDPEKINVTEIRQELLNTDIDISLIEKDPNLQESIKNSQFRNEKQGKGPAVMAVLGPENYKKYFNWAMDNSKNQPEIGKGGDDSKCRGLMQFLGETIALASNQITPEEYCNKTNLRVGKKYQKNTEISKLFNLSTDDEGVKKLKETASIPKGSVIRAYECILSLNK